MNAEIKLKDMTEEQIADLEAQIAEYHKAKEHKPLAWKPKCGESYNVVGGYIIGIHHPKWADDEMDNGAYKQGNCFPTRDLAEAELERRKVIRQIEELVDKYDSERGGAFVVGDDNFQLCYQADCDRVYIMRQNKGNSLYNPMLPCFSSFVTAREIRDEVGEDRVKLLFTKYPIIRGDA